MLHIPIILAYDVLKARLLILPLMLFVTSCNPHLNVVIPVKTVFTYDVTYTKPNGDTVNTWLNMKIGRVNFVSFLTRTAGMDYEFQDFKTKQFIKGEYTVAYLNNDQVSLHPPRWGSYYFTEAVPFPYSCTYCLKGSKSTDYIQVKKGFKELNHLKIEQEIVFSDTTLYVFKGDTVKCMLWKGKNTNYLEKIGQYKVEYVFSPKYAFLEWRYFLPDSSKVILKLRDIQRVK
jgi:hypothetical protein